jgi:SAM-dependent methyltransferase
MEDSTMTLGVPDLETPRPTPGDPVLDRVRSFWDLDAAVYDHEASHHPATAAERAAWSAALHRHLPRPTARILDVGAGTGFLSLMAAALGHRVTALDLSSEMLSRLQAKAEAAGLSVETVHGAAHEPPAGPFDAVISRHLLWTLPQPRRALTSWRGTVPSGGRLLLFEGMWGRADPVEAARQRVRHAIRRLRRRPSGHHGDYDRDLLACLPLAGRSHPETVVTEVEAAGWGTPWLERLPDVEWTRRLALPPFDRLLGVTPSFVVIAECRR